MLWGSSYSDIPQGLQTIREFTTNLVIEAASKCLHLITGDTSLPTSLPGSMSARFRLGASLATACQVIWDLSESYFNGNFSTSLLFSTSLFVDCMVINFGN